MKEYSYAFLLHSQIHYHFQVKIIQSQRYVVLHFSLLRQNIDIYKLQEKSFFQLIVYRSLNSHSQLVSKQGSMAQRHGRGETVHGKADKKQQAAGVKNTPPFPFYPTQAIRLFGGVAHTRDGSSHFPTQNSTKHINGQIE